MGITVSVIEQVSLSSAQLWPDQKVVTSVSIRLMISCRGTRLKGLWKEKHFADFGMAYAYLNKLLQGKWISEEFYDDAWLTVTDLQRVVEEQS